MQGRKKEEPEHCVQALRHIKKRSVRLTMMGIIGNATPLLYQSTHGISKDIMRNPTPLHKERASYDNLSVPRSTLSPTYCELQHHDTSRILGEFS